jgi:cell volume regulation protein A
MEITANNTMLIMACLLFFSVLVGKAGSRFGMPALLLFLGVGMVAGVDGGCLTLLLLNFVLLSPN